MNALPNYYSRSHEELLLEISAAQGAAGVDPEELVLLAGAAEAHVRLQGGFLTRLALQRRGDTSPTDVLYRGPDLTTPKLRASHAMMPVGPSEGPGGQHGFMRWVRHDPIREAQLDPGVASAHLVPRGAESVPFTTRSVTLTENSLWLGLGVTHTVLDGSSTPPFGLSLGEHLYFNSPGSAHDVAIDGQSIDEGVGRGAADEIDAGRAQFWPEFPGAIDVDLPNGNRLRIDSKFKENGGAGARLGGGLGMLLWRPEGDETMLCLEPTVGYGLDGSNDNLIMPPRSVAMLHTAIALR